MQATFALKACCSLAQRQCFWIVTAAALHAASFLRCCSPLQQACTMISGASGMLAAALPHDQSAASTLPIWKVETLVCSGLLRCNVLHHTTLYHHADMMAIGEQMTRAK